jgi:hypothetical protein
MGSAIVHEEDGVSGIFLTCASLTDFRDANIFEPDPEDGAINKVLRSWMDDHLLVVKSSQGDIGINRFSRD